MFWKYITSLKIKPFLKCSLLHFGIMPITNIKAYINKYLWCPDVKIDTKSARMIFRFQINKNNEAASALPIKYWQI